VAWLLMSDQSALYYQQNSKSGNVENFGKEYVLMTICKTLGSSTFKPQYMFLKPCCFAIVASVSSRICLSSPDSRLTPGWRGSIAISDTA
jgi:hypothetical protein